MYLSIIVVIVATNFKILAASVISDKIIFITDSSCLYFFTSDVQDIIKSANSVKILVGGSCLGKMHTLNTSDEWIGVNHIAKFGTHSFTHIFYRASDSSIESWIDIYSKLQLSQFSKDFFNFSQSYYRKYDDYNSSTFKTDRLRSLLVKDKFIFIETSASSKAKITHIIHDSITLQNLPEYMQSTINSSKSDGEPQTEWGYPTVLYSTLAGWGSRCKFSNIYDQLSNLTLRFNANDMLFCEVFLHFNLTHQTSYHFSAYRWARLFTLRDDLLSAFIPDSNAVFYSSPGITFVVMKEAPLVWGNIFQPFSPIVWAFLGVCGILSGLFTYCITGNASYKILSLAKTEKLSQQIWMPIQEYVLLVLRSAYGGMILVGLLVPLYPWTPKTFSELNQTNNFIAATAYSEAVQPEHLRDTKVLNGIKKWRDREVEGPAKSTPSSYLEDDANDTAHRYALFMYDDRKLFFTYGRSQLSTTAKYLHRMETNTESVLREMRYISVAIGSKLQFVVDAIRRNFEAGTWIRWWNLEKNYYKYVAPKLVNKYLEKSLPEERIDFTERSLKVADVGTILVIWSVGIAMALLHFFFEQFYCCRYFVYYFTIRTK
ncbi:uncharacterized protein LOC118435142 [Folsomia candida]|uniref:uncharacterized protein LOC118435142 n=1 Tax=Folsomia candida TaxID=158441 RepID=UPI0016053537|nr:uncharacterized protein LOC118435142 [Folsomia candida]